MAENQTIRLFLFDTGGGVDKAISSIGHLHKDDTITWLVRNQTGRHVDVFVKNFKPPFVTITDPTPPNPLPLDDGDEGSVTGTVTKAPGQGLQKKVSYNVFVGTDMIDPDLIIDGDPNPIKKGGSRTGKKAKGGKKKGGKKR